MRLDLFSRNKLYAALKEAGYPDLPAPRTLGDWITKDSGPESLRLFLAEMLGTKKDPRPDVPDGGFMERWLADDPPPWAEKLTDQIIGQIRALQSESLAESSEATGRALAARLLPQLRAELARGTSARARSKRAATAKPQP